MFKAYFLNLHETPYARILEGRKTSIPKLKFSYLETFFLSINRENSSLCLERKKKNSCVLGNTLCLKPFFETKNNFFFSFFSSEFTTTNLQGGSLECQTFWFMWREILGGNYYRRSPKVLGLWWKDKWGVCRGYNRESSCKSVL